MILVDVNLLVQATVQEAPDHDEANEWLGARLSDGARVGLPWTVLTGFVRVVAQPRAWERPVPVGAALDVVGDWLARPNAWIPEPGPRHLQLLGALLGDQPSPRLVTDAHLAAIALEHGLEICTRHHDFARWSDRGLRWSDPLAELR